MIWYDETRQDEIILHTMYDGEDNIMLRVKKAESNRIERTVSLTIHHP